MEEEGWAMQQRGQAGVAQSGAIIKSRESGSCFDVLVDKYAVCSSHFLAPIGNIAPIGGKQIGKVVKDLRHCGRTSRVDAAAVLLNSGVQTNPKMLGLNVTCIGFVKAAVGQQIHTSGSNSGTTTQKVTTINYSMKNDSVQMIQHYIGEKVMNSNSALWMTYFYHMINP